MLMDEDEGAALGVRAGGGVEVEGAEVDPEEESQSHDRAGKREHISSEGDESA
jgi:hypothetical protein